MFRSEDQSVDFIRSRVERGTTVHTDEAPSWDVLRTRYRVRQINHKLAYSDNDACTNQAESFFSRLRRAEWGQHHHISGLYLSRYAAEMAWREDHRREANGNLFTRLVARVVACAPSVDFTGRWQRKAA